MKKIVLLTSILYFGFIFFQCSKKSVDPEIVKLTKNYNNDGLEYFISHDPIEGNCYIYDKSIVTNWLIVVDDSGNVIKDTTDYAKLSDTTISLKLFIDEIITFREKYKGYQLLLENISDKHAKLKTQDGRLYLIQEAKDSNGIWKAIEKLTPSFCGNSYYSVVLCPRDSCYFTIPIYQGELITRLRFRLLIDEDNFIISNEFIASINRTQFIDDSK